MIAESGTNGDHTPPQDSYFQDIATLAATCCGAPMAVVALSDGKQGVNLEGCHGFTTSDLALLRDELSHECLTYSAHENDVVFKEIVSDGYHSPCVTDQFRSGFQFCAALFLPAPGGAPSGLLAVLDNRPRRLEPRQVEGLHALARLAAHHITCRTRSAARLRDIVPLAGLPADVLRSMVEREPLGVVVLERDGRIAFVNRCGRRLLNLTDLSPAGRVLWDLPLPLADEDLALVREAAEHPEPGGEPFAVALQGDKGANRYLRVRVERNTLGVPGCFLFIEDLSHTDTPRSVPVRKESLGSLQGCSLAMHEVYRQIEDFAPLDTTVLIEGETGTGKELVARSIHTLSGRSSKAFVAVNLAGLSDTLWSSQLFGHRRGAFTGAVDDQIGLIEAAQYGTLFLDEVGDAPLSVQVALLRVLQEREFLRLGETRPRSIDVRIIAATNQDLRRAVVEKQFRADLYYRLAVARIHVPPLRERPEDIPLLVRHFASRVGKLLGKNVLDADPGAVQALAAHSWPGNVRELQNVVESAVIRCRGPRLTLPDLQDELPGLQPAAGKSSDDAVERQRILAALRQAGGNCTMAAHLLGISRATLYRKMHNAEIRRDDWRG